MLPYALPLNFGRAKLQYDMFDLEKLQSAASTVTQDTCGNMKITGGSYRDETRIVHMLQALERLELESADVASVDALSSNDQLARAIMYDFIVLGEAANNVSEAYCV